MAETPETERARAVQRVRDCLRLARGNPNINEAVTAQAMARKLSKKYYIDLDKVEQQERLKANDLEGRPRPIPNFEFWRDIFCLITGEEISKEDFTEHLKNIVKKAQHFAAMMKK